MRSVFFNSANHMVFCLWRCRCQRGHQKFAYLIRTKTQYLLRTLHEPHFFIWTSFWRRLRNNEVKWLKLMYRGEHSDKLVAVAIDFA